MIRVHKKTIVTAKEDGSIVKTESKKITGLVETGFAFVGVYGAYRLLKDYIFKDRKKDETE